MPRFEHREWKEKPHLKALSLKEKLGIILYVIGVPIRSIGWTIEHYWHPLNETLTTHLWANLLKTGFDELSQEQLHALIPVVPMEAMLNKWLTRRMVGPGLNNYNTPFHVPDASARWIHEVPNRTKDDPVILFFHGGAYMLKMLEYQAKWLGYVARKLRNERVSILALDYTITPYAKYPVQLNEALATYDELTKTCNRIIFAGDSAGGNMTAAVSRSLKDRGSPPAWAVVLISGWFRLESEAAATPVRRIADYVPHHNTYKASTLYATPEQIHNDPKVSMLAEATPPDYWFNVFPERTLAVWGGDESLREVNMRFMERTDIVLQYEEPRGLHDVTVTGPGTPATYFILQTLKRWLSSPSKAPSSGSRL